MMVLEYHRGPQLVALIRRKWILPYRFLCIFLYITIGSELPSKNFILRLSAMVLGGNLVIFWATYTGNLIASLTGEIREK